MSRRSPHGCACHSLSPIGIQYVAAGDYLSSDCVFSGRLAPEFIAGLDILEIGGCGWNDRILAIEQENTTLEIRYGVVLCAPGSIWTSANPVRTLARLVANQAGRRGWSFVRWSRPAPGDGIETLTEGEVWFEVSKRVSPGPTPAVPGVGVRVARPEDHETVARMLDASVIAGLNVFERSALPTAGPLHWSIGGTDPVAILAVSDSVPVGCLFGDLASRSVHDGIMRARIVDAFVPKQNLRRGISTLLVHVFEVACARLGVQEMSGTVKGTDFAETQLILAQLRRRGWRADTMMIDFDTGEAA